MLSFWNFSHSIGFHVYDLPALVLGVAMAVMAIVHAVKQKKLRNDGKEQPETAAEQ
jgi:quinol-cytochrome oxidoreductase complex cytochrome b subunit